MAPAGAVCEIAYPASNDPHGERETKRPLSRPGAARRDVALAMVSRPHLPSSHMGDADAERSYKKNKNRKAERK